MRNGPTFKGAQLLLEKLWRGIFSPACCAWMSLSKIPEAEFEKRFADHKEVGILPTTSSMLHGGPVPARGRVERAQGLYRGMTKEERQEFLAWALLGGG
jgi:hypothetical protein